MRPAPPCMPPACCEHLEYQHAYMEHHVTCNHLPHACSDGRTAVQPVRCVHTATALWKQQPGGSASAVEVPVPAPTPQSAPHLAKPTSLQQLPRDRPLATGQPATLTVDALPPASTAPNPTGPLQTCNCPPASLHYWVPALGAGCSLLLTRKSLRLYTYQAPLSEGAAVTKDQQASHVWVQLLHHHDGFAQRSGHRP